MSWREIWARSPCRGFLRLIPLQASRAAVSLGEDVQRRLRGPGPALRQDLGIPALQPPRLWVWLSSQGGCEAGLGIEGAVRPLDDPEVL